MRFIVRFLAIVGLLSILFIALIVVVISRLHVGRHVPPAVADGTVLTLAVEGPFIEESPTRTGLSSLLSGHNKKLREVVDGIDQAARDSRIKGLVLKIDASTGMAQAQELRAAIKRFRTAGKFVYAYADDYGESAPGNGQYYLASAGDQLWLQPTGEVMLTDVMFEAPFLQNLLAKVDAEPQFIKRSEYKTAPETFTEHGYTPAAREMMESLANDLTTQLATDIAASRNISVDDARAVFARGPMTADEAIQAKLIDHSGYADEVVDAAKKAAGASARTMTLPDYYAQAVSDKGGAPNIALIYEVGDIGTVSGSIDPSEDRRNLDTGNAVVQGFAKAMATPSVKVIVFRVDSPGGSVSGSESIRRMVVRAKQAGKKVVVSMGAVAASGGYWISADADKIVAEPATLTGSIGVFTGKFVVSKGLADIGITTDRTTAGPFAAMDSPFSAFTPEQTQKLNTDIDTTYNRFVSIVANGRNMPAGAVGNSAKGRVWSGQQAKQLGLVDTLGGLEDAFTVARQVGNFPSDQPSVIRVYPEPISPLEAAVAVLKGDEDIQSDVGDTLTGLKGPGGTAIRALAPLFREGGGDMVRMPDLGPVR